MSSNLLMIPTILILSIIASAAQAEQDPFDRFSSCPKTLKEFHQATTALEEEAKTRFAKKSAEELEAILNRGDADSELLLFIAPHLLESSLKNDIATSCWTNFEDLQQGLKGGDQRRISRHMRFWLGCVETKFRKVPPRLQKIHECLKQILPESQGSS